MSETKTWCPQCGPDVDVDEDGCCGACGADATGDGADRAHRWRATAESAVAGAGEWRRLAKLAAAAGNQAEMEHRKFARTSLAAGILAGLMVGFSIGLVLASLFCPGTAHAQPKPEPSVSRSSSPTADYTYTTAMTNNCQHPVTLSEHQFRHALPDALLCSRLRKFGVGTLLQPGETWTVIVWRKP